jgi:DNA-binding response OmpR family regulator
MGHLLLMIGNGRGRFGSYQDHLRTSGFRIITASEPEEAVRLGAAVRPAVGVIDVSTLKETGWDICRSLRAIPILRSTPLLVMTDGTGALRRGVNARARALGCTALPKNLKADELVDFVAAVIGLSSRSDRRSEPSVTSAGNVLGEPGTEDD